MAENSAPIEIFCSYAHEDETWLQKLKTHLSLLQRQGLISLWHDRLIAPGTDWVTTIDTHLETASFILLFVSADFLASNYCYGIEMKRALEREAAGEARVIPILIRPTDWNGAPFTHLQALPTDAKPITSWQNEDTALADVAAGIRRVIVEELPQFSASTPRAALPAIWNVPYPRNPFFLGREAELSAVEEALSTGQHAAIAHTQAISGLGGIGKTQLALEYAYRHRTDYRIVFWVPADTHDTLNAAYGEIANMLNLPDRQQHEQRLVVKAVKDWLTRHHDWLLILDNADDLSVARNFLPTNAPGHILLTTRAHAMGRLARRIEVKKLGVEDACRFLLYRSGLLAEQCILEEADPMVREAAHEIVRELDGLPLALDQAGAYIEETNCSLYDYLELYRTRRAELLRLRGGLIDDHPEPVATTWRLAFDRVEASNAAAAVLLRLCAFLAPDDIPETIIGQETTELTSPLRQLVDNPLQLNAALAVLQSYSLITRHPDTHTLEVHRLVQAVLRDAMSEEAERTWAEHAVRVIQQLFPWPEIENWKVCRQLLPHAQACAVLIKRWQIALTEGAHLLNHTGCYLHECGEHARAQECLEQALAIKRTVLGEQHPDTLASLNNLGEVYQAQGKYAEAETAYLQVLTIYRVVLGGQHPETLSSLNNLANAYQAQRKYAEAEAAHLQVLAIRRTILGEQHPGTAASLNNLANAYQAQRKYAEAETTHLQVLAIYRVVLGGQHPETLSSLNNLGEVYRALGKYAEAEAVHLHILAVRCAVLGEQHPDTAMSLNNLAVVYQTQRKHEEALPLFELALAILQEKLGPEYPYTKMVQSNVEWTLQAIKRNLGGQGTDLESSQ